MERLIHCRKCGKLMKRELVDGWKAKIVCSCGFSEFQVLYGSTRSLAPVLGKTKVSRVKDSKNDLKLQYEQSLSEREKEELNIIREVLSLLTSGEKGAYFINLLLDRIYERMNAKTTSFYLLESGNLILKYGRGIKEEFINKLSLKIGEGITGIAAEEKEIVIIEDISVDKRSKKIEGMDEETLKAMVAIPLLYESHLLGVLNLKVSNRQSFHNDEIVFLTIMANLLTLAIHLQEKIN
ncbi:MAG: GAF domain-containing protein [Candidatus Schekmanbacteria bacterium]|nr:MAG: GAF domain-containing protein [Candidatus Schekmanbacteria bacterium]